MEMRLVTELTMELAMSNNTSRRGREAQKHNFRLRGERCEKSRVECPRSKKRCRKTR
jgi:hypothetical protein